MQVDAKFDPFALGGKQVALQSLHGLLRGQHPQIIFIAVQVLGKNALLHLAGQLELPFKTCDNTFLLLFLN